MDLGTINITTLKPETGLIRPVLPQAKDFADVNDSLAIDPARVDFDQIKVEETAKPEEKAAVTDTADESEVLDTETAEVASNIPIVTPLLAAPVAVQIAETTAATAPADQGIVISTNDIFNIAVDKAVIPATNTASIGTVDASANPDALALSLAGEQAAAATDNGIADPNLQNLINKNLSAPAAQKPMAKAAATSDNLTKTPAADSPLPLNPSSPKDAAGDPNLDTSTRLSRQVPVDGKDLAPTKVETKIEASAPQALPAGSQPIQIQTQAPVDYKNIQAAVVAQPVAEQVAVHIVKAAKDGVDKIKIQLTPEALGRVEIRLEMDKDALVKAVIATDKPEAAEWLARDAKQLERALQDAGIKADTSNMEFQNRNQSTSHNFAGQFSDNYNNGPAAHKYYGAKNGMADLNTDSNVIVKNLYVRDGGVNIMV
ncbi:MAG: flagellar hook-length control protein FliK [Alphaproteobacteria bacterium]|nr:MAG: flagellar hook-length control protein FliK [Alphaproteobacteria bacterium]